MTIDDSHLSSGPGWLDSPPLGGMKAVGSGMQARPCLPLGAFGFIE